MILNIKIQPSVQLRTLKEPAPILAARLLKELGKMVNQRVTVFSHKKKLTQIFVLISIMKKKGITFYQIEGIIPVDDVPYFCKKVLDDPLIELIDVRIMGIKSGPVHVGVFGELLYGNGMERLFRKQTDQTFL